MAFSRFDAAEHGRELLGANSACADLDGHKETPMKEAEVRERAFAMPLTSPAFPRGPYRFC
jgi:hypothetical protein